MILKDITNSETATINTDNMISFRNIYPTRLNITNIAKKNEKTTPELLFLPVEAMIPQQMLQVVFEIKGKIPGIKTGISDAFLTRMIEVSADKLFRQDVNGVILFGVGRPGLAECLGKMITGLLQPPAEIFYQRSIDLYDDRVIPIELADHPEIIELNQVGARDMIGSVEEMILKMKPFLHDSAGHLLRFGVVQKSV